MRLLGPPPPPRNPDMHIAAPWRTRAARGERLWFVPDSSDMKRRTEAVVKARRESRGLFWFTTPEHLEPQKLPPPTPPTRPRMAPRSRTLAPADGGLPAIGNVPGAGETMVGYASTTNVWSEIVDASGRYLERIAPGAFRKTLLERGGRVRCILEHGGDAVAGNRPLGEVVSLYEDQFGLAYRVSLFTETSYVRDLLPAIGAGLYGSSFRFRPIVEDYDPKPGRSDFNPRGLPLRTVKELQLLEFGPCVFPAYPTASASLAA